MCKISSVREFRLSAKALLKNIWNWNWFLFLENKKSGQKKCLIAGKKQISSKLFGKDRFQDNNEFFPLSLLWIFYHLFYPPSQHSIRIEYRIVILSEWLAFHTLLSSCSAAI